MKDPNKRPTAAELLEVCDYFVALEYQVLSEYILVLNNEKLYAYFQEKIIYTIHTINIYLYKPHVKHACLSFCKLIFYVHA